VRTAKRLQSGQWGKFQKYGDGYCNAVYVDDLVSAIVLALESPAAVGHAFNIGGQGVVTWNEYFRRFNEALQLPPLVTRPAARSAVKAAVVERLGRIADAIVSRYEPAVMQIYLRGGPLGRLMKRVKTLLQCTPSPRELGDLYGRRAIYTDEKARCLLHYQPQFDLERGLKLCAMWLANGGFIEPAVLAATRSTDADAYRHKSNDSLSLERVTAVNA
jgi:nucleoside-diphosphate-sugar epimerase